MTKPLSEMTKEELWALFPIILTQHDAAWALRYAREQERVERAVGKENIARVSHIGSTAVPGLLAKPTIDILLEITEACDTDALKATLTADGWLFCPQPQNPPPHMMFMKGYTPEGFIGQAFHLHVRYGGDWDELYFRDYLISHPEAARGYAALKEQLKQRFEHDRDAYTDAKEEFVLKYTDIAREEFRGRYTIILDDR